MNAVDEEYNRHVNVDIDCANPRDMKVSSHVICSSDDLPSSGFVAGVSVNEVSHDDFVKTISRNSELSPDTSNRFVVLVLLEEPTLDPTQRHGHYGEGVKESYFDARYAAGTQMGRRVDASAPKIPEMSLRRCAYTDVESKQPRLEMRRDDYVNMSAVAKEEDFLSVRRVKRQLYDKIEPEAKQLELKSRRNDYANMEPREKKLVLEVRRLEYADMDCELKDNLLAAKREKYANMPLDVKQDMLRKRREDYALSADAKEDSLAAKREKYANMPLDVKQDMLRKRREDYARRREIAPKRPRANMLSADAKEESLALKRKKYASISPHAKEEMLRKRREKYAKRRRDNAGAQVALKRRECFKLSIDVLERRKQALIESLDMRKKREIRESH